MGLKRPEGVACNDQSLLVVADTGNGRFLRYTVQDELLKPGPVEIKLNQISYPTKIKLNSKNEIYAFDRKERRIIRLSPAGEFMGYLNLSGLPPPASYTLRSFDIDLSDNIYVLDILSGRVLVLNPEGEYQKHIDLPKEYGFFSDLTVDFQGNVLLIDSVDAIVFSAAHNSSSFSSLTKSLKEYMRFPSNIITDSRGRIYLIDRNGGRIIILGQDGSFLERQLEMGWREGWLNYPGQMCINQKGEIFVADTKNNRVQIFKAVE